MKHLLLRFQLLMISVLVSAPVLSQKLYQASYGPEDAPAVIFLHGGPGFNSAIFEIGAAEALAARGYRVVIYDRRGTARSKVKKADYTFTEAEKDLKKVMKQQGLERATLIGHSFGGALAIRFALHAPDMVDNVVLVGAPLDYPAMFGSIRKHCHAIYTTRQDTTNLLYMDTIATLDPATLEYSAYCFYHAMACGLYQCEAPTEAATEIYNSMMQDKRSPLLMASKQDPVLGFHAAHQYTTMDLSDDLRTVMARTPVHGIYGLEDGLFDAATREGIRQIIGEERFHELEAASHNAFLDQQERFLGLMEEIVGD